MKKILFALLVTFTALSLDSFYSAHGAELIQVPQGVLLRSLTSWENVSRLEIFEDGHHFDLQSYDNVASYSFSQATLCRSSGYKAVSLTGENEFIELSHLCHDGQSEDDQEFQFAFISDSQLHPDRYLKTLVALSLLRQKLPNIRFVLHGGDYVQESTEENWKLYRNITSQLFSRSLPILPILGNHEYKKDPGLAFFRQVFGKPETKTGYFDLFDFGFAALVVLDSNLETKSDEENAIQTRWLEETLSQLSQQKKMVIAAFHHAPFSSGIGVVLRPQNPDYIKKHWTPLFERYHVSLVLSGHEHIYERFLKNGIPYLVAGPSGGRAVFALPIHAADSVKLMAGLYTITVVTVRRDQGIEIKTFTPELAEIDRAFFGTLE